jgi:hypothetical protein
MPAIGGDADMTILQKPIPQVIGHRPLEILEPVGIFRVNLVVQAVVDLG